MASDISTLKPCADLWAALRDMRIEEPGAVLSFDGALARQTGWSLPRARAVSLEYRRFLYLAAAAGQGEVTPSEAVDRAWHLHLTYSRHYWDVLCGEILRRPLHHVPSRGGEAEAERHRRQYEETLLGYERAFGIAPPEEIWPRPAAAAAAGNDAEESPLWPNEPHRIQAMVGAGLAMAVAAWLGGVVAFLAVLLIAAAIFALADHLSERSRPRKRSSKTDCGGGCGAGGYFSDDSCPDASCGGGCGGD